MNAYYPKSANVNSNNDIFKGYLNKGEQAVIGWSKRLDQLLCWLSMMVRALTGEKVLRIARVSGVAVCLVGLIGVIGAMESGALGLGLGIVIATVFIGIEYLCLRRY
ncbi:MAG: hypothetical protein IJW92_00345 [Clostridia bacterium]|nr:hypothetical protein [Clostridia bacterium]